MQTVVAAVQMVSGPNLKENLQQAGQLIADAAGNGASLVVLPEVFAVLDGAPMASLAESEGDWHAPIHSFLSTNARRHGVTLVAGTIPLSTRPGSENEPVPGGRVRAACLVINAEGQIEARYDKIHLFDVDVADLLNASCAACHSNNAAGVGFMEGNPDLYGAVKNWTTPLLDFQSPGNSLLLTKGVHVGPAWDPADSEIIRAWIALEALALGIVDEEPPTTALFVPTMGLNTVPLDPLG